MLTDALGKLPEPRNGRNKRYTMRDAALGAFSVFFMQYPSFLAYQRHMQQTKGHNNADSLFGVKRIPTDPQIRNLLDQVDPVHLRAPFWAILERVMTDEQAASAFESDGGWPPIQSGAGSVRWMVPSTFVRRRSTAQNVP
jgi:hypothetical protein